MNPGMNEGVWDSVLELTKSAQEKKSDSMLWAIQLGSTLNSAGLTLPSVELSHLLISHICWNNNNPIAWKFLEKALALNFVPPMLILALLSTRVIPSRRVHPAAYRLYLELLKRHGSSFASQLHESNHEKILKAVDDALHLSDVFGIHASDPAVISVLFVFSNVWQLIDASLDDEGLLEYTLDKSSRWLTGVQDMEIDDHGHFLENRIKPQEGLLKMNTLMAIEMIVESLQNKVTTQILFLVRQNMPSHWRGFYQHLQLLASRSLALRNSKLTTQEIFAQVASDTCKHLHWQSKTNLQHQFHAVMAPGCFVPSAVQCHGASCSSLWLPIDLFLEDAMEGILVTPTCAIDTLTGMLKSLQALYSTTWHDTFLGLWIAILRLVQRERNPCEGPVARLDTCLCMLLSITPLVLINLTEEENKESEFSRKEDKQSSRGRRHELVSSLQQLGEYEGLLTPPSSVAPIANQAAIKAMMYLSGLNISSGYLDSVSVSDVPINCDISAYAWPGYVNARVNQIPRVSGQVTGWSSLMKGSPLTSAMMNVLVSSPASSLAEVEKIYEIAVGGSDDEKICAATVLCGSSVTRGWNVQEHTVLFILRLLSPPMPVDYSGTESHLISYGPFLNVLLVGIATVDIVQIFSLHGLVPHLAGALMPICEVFGSCSPKISWSLTTGEEINAHAVFSNAFTLLLKLWSFDHTPIEQTMGDVPSVASQLCPEYLLLVRNSQLVSLGNATTDQSRGSRFSKLLTLPSTEPIFMDSFPKLKCWYRQHQACIASPLSGLMPGTPVHQIVEALLTMLFKKMNRGTTSGSSSSSGSSMEEAVLRLQLPAWDILEALPFVLDAALTACAHDKLSPRDLATGLKDLADFLPASLASILSYFTAEVTRGVWKPVSMNGTDWPSPAANLSMVEQQIHKVLAATGIDVPSLATVGNSTPTLPLPLAALLSLTITYKIDKANERYLNLVGRGVVVLAACCPWPCMPIVAALWAQKAKRWSDFLIFSASRAVFNLNNDAVVQLLRSCFSSVLGFNASPRCKNGGVGALLGHGLGARYSNGMSPVAPGIFYLRVAPFIRNFTFVTEEILSLLMMSVKDIATGGLSVDTIGKLKKSKFGMRYRQVSLTSAMTRIKLAASTGASFVWISGGLNLLQALLKETLPSWFISTQRPDCRGESGSVVATLSGYALAYFAVLCGLFAWRIDAVSSASKLRSRVLASHLEFMATALEGNISLGCDLATWRAYVSGFLSLLVRCVPAWLQEIDVHILKSLSKGLRQWNEEELALALVGVSGINAMGAAAELIIQSAQ
ncbi:mediator of RNA polymerase II transcription subunit 33A isoform X2 [Beta vulgaris subsp. vulgaris]|uniref:mediator of RNA polymerase II transcription subunit 33A isoform X2 n=1 Tax=Beta vulgaris subsp. vulgaris TaxID=3555 RepID=UPI0009009D10|nr:mediator of RNA polymerase II transcription subunit 33A isoform X2 [Beta vulgaris subsp. vulgaris]